jgi:hypothetical protein
MPSLPSSRALLGGRCLALLCAGSNSDAPAGNHVLTVEPDLAAPFFRAQWDDVTFLGD